MIRKFAAGIALAAAVALPLAGCGHSADTSGAGVEKPTASPSPSTNPSEVLSAAVAKSEAAGSYTFVVGDESTKSNGTYDAASKGMYLDATGDSSTQLWYFGTDIYVAGDFPGVPKGKTIHVDLKKITPGGEFSAVADPLGGLHFLTVAAAVQQPTETTFSGTFDLSKLDANGSPGTKLFVSALTKRIKGGVTAIPFTASTDDQGRVSSFKTTFPGADNGKDLVYELTIAGYGSAKPVTKPKGAVEASAALYKALNAATG
jgi:hypothetical protein